jgi:alpha-galactosidase
MDAPADTVHLHAGETSVVIDCSGDLPVIRHWGAALGVGSGSALATATERTIVHGGLDVVAPCSILPQHAEGWPGRPGLQGHRQGGRDWAPWFSGTRIVRREDGIAGEGGLLETESRDDVAGLVLRATIELTPVGALRTSIAVSNIAASRYLLSSLVVTLPVHTCATEVLSLDGRWVREFQQHRRPLTTGALTAENRTGRTSHEHAPFVAACEVGAREWSGSVWAAHLAHGGNHSWFAEVLPDGRRYLQLGELLAAGEICLEPGETYVTPTVVAAHSSRGLTPMSWVLHRDLRSRAPRPPVRRVLVNTWEAVYFRQDFDVLCRLADAAAAAGCERFVLDDGWFGGRRDDTSSLGDWTVSADAHPKGLKPLIDHVRSRGLDFGIWIEPEMVSEDSDTHRAHPEWVLGDRRYPMVRGRNQLVLNLDSPDAYSHVAGMLHRLLDDHDISFVKWDMNRVHVQATGAGGAAGSSRQAAAVVRLMDELRSQHPAVEFEACASGGGRIDHDSLRRAARAWTSDCIDPVERQTIQRGASYVVPNEVMGMHVGARTAHATGRPTTMAFRCATALFGWMGVECNLLTIDDDDREVLVRAIALHKQHRALLHSGDNVRFDTDDPTALAHGTYAPDRSEALVAWAQLGTSSRTLPPLWRLPDLVPDAVYDVRCEPLELGIRGAGRAVPEWIANGVRLTGAELAAVGLQPPSMWPGTALVVHLRRIDERGTV